MMKIEAERNFAQVEALMESGDLIAASRLLNQAVLLNEDDEEPTDDPQMAVLRSRLLRMLGRAGQARDGLREWCTVFPKDRALAVEQARVAATLGDWAGADEAFSRAYGDGDIDDAWLGEWIEILSSRLGRHHMAIRVALSRCEKVPTDASRWFALGLAFQRAQRYERAIECYRDAEERNSNEPMLHNNIGAAYLELKCYVKAQHELEVALKLNPYNPLAWTNLATAHLKQGQLDGSLVAAERACTLLPDYPIALQTYSYVLKELQYWDGALLAAQRAMAVEPHNESLVWTLAMLELLKGDYHHGWRHHEARWGGSPELRDVTPGLPMPRWNGESLAGKTLFVWGEQGHGDVLQFVRFLPLLAERVKSEGGTLAYCCFRSLYDLLAHNLQPIVGTITPHDAQTLPTADYHLPLCSLPLLFNVTLEQLPLQVGYIQPEPSKVDAWRARLRNQGDALKVGLVWSGSRTHQRNPLRSVSPLALAKVFRTIEGVEFISLQMDGEQEVEAMCEAGLPIVDASGQVNSFDDTAALIANLDLVITVCTSVAHLAGAMNVPTWVLLDVNPHWVWMTERRDSPWYPSALLYRQQAYGEWMPVLDRVAKDLQSVARSR